MLQLKLKRKIITSSERIVWRAGSSCTRSVWRAVTFLLFYVGFEYSPVSRCGCTRGRSLRSAAEFGIYTYKVAASQSDWTLSLILHLGIYLNEISLVDKRQILYISLISVLLFSSRYWTARFPWNWSARSTGKWTNPWNCTMHPQRNINKLCWKTETGLTLL